MADAYTTIVDYVETELNTLTLDLVTKGGSLDDALNADVDGHAHVEEPEDYRETEQCYTGGDYMRYHVDVHYLVAGDEGHTAVKAREFADSLRSKFNHGKGKITGYTHWDTLVQWDSQKDNTWNEATAFRHSRHRLVFRMQEDN